jgi:hypothetical protein
MLSVFNNNDVISMANKGSQTGKGTSNKVIEGDGRRTPFKRMKENIKKNWKI